MWAAAVRGLGAGADASRRGAGGGPAGGGGAGRVSDEAESPCPDRLRAIDAVLEELVTPRGAGAVPPPSGSPPPPRALALPGRPPRPLRGAVPLARRCLGLGDPSALSDEGGPAEAGLQEPLPGGATSCGSGPAPGAAGALCEGADGGSTPLLFDEE